MVRDEDNSLWNKTLTLWMETKPGFYGIYYWESEGQPISSDETL